ncbi:MAG TPA: DMT family transporter [Casimicrobiaceae bacterium]|nr:DMT family transporter [Casimicrobiaceae bacterium]
MKHEHVPVRAVLLICAATLCFASLDTAVKYLSARYPVPLLVWARWTIQALAIVAWLAPRSGASFVRTAHLAHNLVRGAVLIGSSICFVYALRDLPLANVTALNYSTPMMVVVLAVVVLRERLTPTRVAFVVAGVVGMLLIVKPGTDVFRGASLLALASAAFYATFQIMTRRMASEDAGVLLFYPALVGTLAMSVALAFSLDSIVAMPWTHVAMLVVGGMVGTLGHFLFILAFQRGAASALTPFTYVHLVWATLIGWLVFDTFPDGWSLAGMAIIAGSGLWITLHERWRSAADAARAGPVTVD